MSVSSSSPSNSSLGSVHPLCLNSNAGKMIIDIFYTIRLVVLIPVSVFVLHLGVKQWRQHRSFQASSHSDIFTYNLAVMELIWSLGALLYFIGVSSNFPEVAEVARGIIGIIFFGVVSSHAVTCVDRYLAVVHPVKYRELRRTRGVTIRNVSIISVWLSSVLWTYVSHLCASAFSFYLYFSALLTSLVTVCFCSLSVLSTLYRPGPGGGNRVQIDQSKQRAFITVMAIMGVLCLSLFSFLIPGALNASGVLCPGVNFVVQASLMWLSLPSSLVSPLLYLHKAGKLRCWQQVRE